MNPDHEEFPVTLDDATKAKLDEVVTATGLPAGEVLRLAIETGLRVMESARQN
ncbi:MAG: Ribbon-helix-helix protein, copG family [Verrucomicrobia bacterium]|nr:MAG: Ribbon-helix-helix protein, copG family [Verrucomicrobiota bacterium]